MAKTKKSLRARKTKKTKCPTKVAGITPMQSSDTLAFGRMGGRHSNARSYSRTDEKKIILKESHV